jgi:hypothetical protein
VKAARDGGRCPKGSLDLFGSADIPGGPPALGDLRRGRCYELSAFALAFGSAPADAMLVHGSIDGGTDLGRFGHAWLRLADGRIWEPREATVYPASWEAWADARVEVEYTRKEAFEMILTYDHWGPWHDASEFRVVSEREATESKIPFEERVRR